MVTEILIPFINTPTNPAGICFNRIRNQFPAGLLELREGTFFLGRGGGRGEGWDLRGEGHQGLLELREGTFYLGGGEGGGLGPQRGGSSMKVNTKRGGSYLFVSYSREGSPPFPVFFS